MEELQHNEIQRSLGRIEGKLDGIKDSVDQHSKDIQKLQTGQTNLKIKLGGLAGGASLVVLVAFEWVKSQFK